MNKTIHFSIMSYEILEFYFSWFTGNSLVRFKGVAGHLHVIQNS